MSYVKLRTTGIGQENNLLNRPDFKIEDPIIVHNQDHTLHQIHIKPTQLEMFQEVLQDALSVEEHTT